MLENDSVGQRPVDGELIMSSGGGGRVEATAAGPDLHTLQRRSGGAVVNDAADERLRARRGVLDRGDYGICDGHWRGRSRRPGCAPHFLISQQTVRRRHLRDTRHPDVPAWDDPLSSGKLLELNPPGRSRYTQRDWKVDVIKTEGAQCVCFRIQPENAGEFRLRADLGGSELKSGQACLGSVSADRGVAVRIDELVRHQRRCLWSTIDFSAGYGRATGRIDMIPGDSRHRPS